MEKYLLHILSENNNPMLLNILNGLEEQGIMFKVVSLDKEVNIDLNKVPFNVVVVVKGNETYLMDRDFNNKFNMSLIKSFNNTSSDSKRYKNFGLDIGRYIKGVPLKGDWNESK